MAGIFTLGRWLTIWQTVSIFDSVWISILRPRSTNLVHYIVLLRVSPTGRKVLLLWCAEDEWMDLIFSVLYTLLESCFWRCILASLWATILNPAAFLLRCLHSCFMLFEGKLFFCLKCCSETYWATILNPAAFLLRCLHSCFVPFWG